MRVNRVGLSCLLAVLAISAFAAANASAALYDVKALPEAGRCVKVALGTGVYRGSGCTVKATAGKGSYEWVPASVTEKLTFTGSGLETTLATTGHPTIKCLAANLSGEPAPRGRIASRARSVVTHGLYRLISTHRG